MQNLEKSKMKKAAVTLIVALVATGMAGAQPGDTLVQ